MEPISTSILDFGNLPIRNSDGNAADTEGFKHSVDEILQKVDKITQHKWAWPFMQPVDVKGLGLHDYYEVIEKPMDFSTIKNQMEAKDGMGYKNVREICADVRLVFKNAMKYYDERSDVHEKRREDEEAEAQLDMQLAQEAAHAKTARDLSDELYEVDMHLEELSRNGCSKVQVSRPTLDMQ
ncbi:unnamed protein product [Dovyalis caffra]|uniref:Bromo domain-containing protein n=1 Tax=Dovyalis caffra TaxID=77055 RepID=A0AAV1QZP7_9ROSI|nr:unnamed protein product [Dovyalis caffra]